MLYIKDVLEIAAILLTPLLNGRHLKVVIRNLLFDIVI